MIVATSVDFNYDAAVRCGLPLTVATKYVNLARRHFAKRGMQVRFIKLHGALEIARKWDWPTPLLIWRIAAIPCASTVL